MVVAAAANSFGRHGYGTNGVGAFNENAQLNIFFDEPEPGGGEGGFIVVFVGVDEPSKVLVEYADRAVAIKDEIVGLARWAGLLGAKR